MKALIISSLLMVGCVNSATVCATRLGLKQTDSAVSFRSEGEKDRWQECVNEVEQDRANRRAAVGQALQNMSQSFQPNQSTQVNCQTQCLGFGASAYCTTHCQ